MIGNVGESNHLAFFVGHIRSVRISKGEQYQDDFVPDEQFQPTKEAVLIYDGKRIEGERAIDLSGNENHGVWNQL